VQAKSNSDTNSFVILSRFPIDQPIILSGLWILFNDMLYFLNPGVDEIFRPSRLALGPTQPPVKWVPVLSQG